MTRKQFPGIHMIKKWYIEESEISTFLFCISAWQVLNTMTSIAMLCLSKEDDVENCSAVEGVLETILILIKQNDVECALKKVIESTLKMKGHGDSWSRILHTQLLRDNDIREVYIKCVKCSNEQEKKS